MEMEPQLTLETATAVTEDLTPSMVPPRADSLLLAWALYFSRFDPLAAMAPDFETER